MLKHNIGNHGEDDDALSLTHTLTKTSHKHGRICQKQLKCRFLSQLPINTKFHLRYYNKWNIIVLNVNYKIWTLEHFLYKSTMNCCFGMREDEKKIMWLDLKGRHAISLPPAGWGLNSSKVIKHYVKHSAGQLLFNVIQVIFEPNVIRCVARAVASSFAGARASN